MEIADIQAVWGHIKALHPNTPKERIPRLTQTLARAWCTELDEYSLSQVMGAVERQAGKSRYWPDLAEIKGQLPTKSPAGATKPQISGEADRRAKEAQDKLFQRMKAEGERLAPLRRAAGLPGSVAEARAAGMRAVDWYQALETAGLNCPDGVFQEGAKG